MLIAVRCRWRMTHSLLPAPCDQVPPKRLFATGIRRSAAVGFRSVAPTLETFKKRLDNFTDGQLRYISWNNLFLGMRSLLDLVACLRSPNLGLFPAGGCVLACLLPPEDIDVALWERGDIDLWIVGLDKQRAHAKVSES